MNFYVQQGTNSQQYILGYMGQFAGGGTSTYNGEKPPTGVLILGGIIIILSVLYTIISTSTK